MKTTIRVGNVSEVYPDEGMVSVTYPQFDDATSGKLPLFSFTDEYKMPKVGDQVLVLHFENGAQEGIVLGHYWNKKNLCPKPGKPRWWKSLSPPYADKPEKAFMFYDDDTETLTIHAPKIVLEAICDEHGEPGEITLNAKGDSGRIDIHAEGRAGQIGLTADGDGGTITETAKTLTLVDDITTNSGLYVGEKDVISESVISGAHHTHTGAHGETSPPH